MDRVAGNIKRLILEGRDTDPDYILSISELPVSYSNAFDENLPCTDRALADLVRTLPGLTLGSNPEVGMTVELADGEKNSNRGAEFSSNHSREASTSVNKPQPSPRPVSLSSTQSAADNHTLPRQPNSWDQPQSQWAPNPSPSPPTAFTPSPTSNSQYPYIPNGAPVQSINIMSSWENTNQSWSQPSTSNVPQSPSLDTGHHTSPNISTDAPSTGYSLAPVVNGSEYVEAQVIPPLSYQNLRSTLPSLDGLSDPESSSLDQFRKEISQIMYAAPMVRCSMFTKLYTGLYSLDLQSTVMPELLALYCEKYLSDILSVVVINGETYLQSHWIYTPGNQYSLDPTLQMQTQQSAYTAPRSLPPQPQFDNSQIMIPSMHPNMASPLPPTGHPGHQHSHGYPALPAPSDPSASGGPHNPAQPPVPGVPPHLAPAPLPPTVPHHQELRHAISEPPRHSHPQPSAGGNTSASSRGITPAGKKATANQPSEWNPSQPTVSGSGSGSGSRTGGGNAPVEWQPTAASGPSRYNLSNLEADEANDPNSPFRITKSQPMSFGSGKKSSRLTQY